MAVDQPQVFRPWLEKLEACTGSPCVSFDDYLSALKKRQQFFHECGCRLSDHGVDTIYADAYTAQEIDAIFRKARAGKQLEEAEVKKFKSAMLYEFGKMNHDLGWTQQFHMLPMRNNNTRMARALGPDTGFDSIGDWRIAQPLSRLLDRLDQTDQLAKTILYTLNPRDNMVLTTMLGNFQDGSVPGKMQFGSGWWFNDTKEGMEDQMSALRQVGLLSRFVGMLTDSRSFLSYPRHDYFRRILCNLLGEEMDKGIIPNDMSLMGRMVRDISYNNAATYFGFDLPRIES